MAISLGVIAAPGGATAHATSTPKISAALQALMAANPTQRLPVIVQVNEAHAPFASGQNDVLAQQALSLLSSKGVGVGPLPIIDGAAGWATAAQIQALSSLPQVARIDQDSTVAPQKPSTSGPTGHVSSLDPREVHADKVWQQGGYGHGVTVAVLDSGVAANADLVKNGNRILASVGFAGPRDPNHPDPGGHGSHIAGTIAGDGSASAGQYVGVAPHANIVDVQVLDANGNGRISSVLAGLDWVIVHQAQYNIRVVNMSFGAPAQGSYKTDPLAAGVEVAWRHGLVVVAAAGNGGPNSGTVVTPGDDPYIITVGSTDDQATLSTSDDTVGWWSAWGTPTDSTRKPEVVAPGRRIISIRVPGSTLDRLLPDHVVMASNGATYFRLTGTSMSTAVVSGAVALLVERQPNLTPDQVKQILTSNTQSFGNSSPPASSGSGLVDAYKGANAAGRTRANQGLRHADALAMTLYPMLYGQPLVWKNLNYLGQTWAGLTWATLNWTTPAWDNYAWDNIAWDNIAWGNIAWDQSAWDNIAWDQSAWDNIAWDNLGWD